MISPMLCLFIVASVRITVLYYHCSEPSSRTKFYVDQLNVTLAMYDSKTETRIPRNALFEIAFNRHLKKNCWHINWNWTTMCARAARHRAASCLNAPLVFLSLSVNIICLSSAVRQSSGTELFDRYFSLIWNSLFARTYRVICYIQRHFRSFIA